MAFSRQGLIDQLSSEYGSQFPVEDATFAVDSLNVDWNEQAVKKAQSYLDFTSFSCQGLIDQLSSQYGSQFTTDQATHGATAVGLC
jgi:Host cell surface-exposed lipoprotein